MHRLVVTVALLGGCDTVFDLDEIETPDGLCFGRSGQDGAGLFDVCLMVNPPPTMTGVVTLDTGTDIDPADCTQIVKQADLNETEVCIIAAQDITITSNITTRGTRPLVLAAVRTIVISGGVSVASRRGGTNGAGAFYSQCPTSLDGVTGNGLSGGAGGAGGSHQTTGGRGGYGDGNINRAMPQSVPEPAFVRGGCDGGDGGGGSVSARGDGGGGGGALYVMAGESITISGVLDASGEAGLGGAAGMAGSSGGGAGGAGGSGGLIALDAPMITLESTATLVANGGAGGGGGSSTQAGANGTDVDLTTTFPFRTPSATGGSNNAGGRGGVGAALEVPAGDGGNGNGAGGSAGGGGGGGTGYIKIFARQTINNGASTPGAT